MLHAVFQVITMIIVIGECDLNGLVDNAYILVLFLEEWDNSSVLLHFIVV